MILTLLLIGLASQPSDIVGYVQVSPDDCQVEYLADDNEIYTFYEDCPEYP